MDGRLKVGHTYSQTGEYGINELTVLLLREKELAKGDIIYIEHPKNGLPVVYQVTRVFPHKRVREYEAALLSEGMVVNDFNDSTLLAKAYHWGWMDKDGSLRPLRYPITPNTQVYLADREIIAKFTKPKSDWKLLLGTDPSTDLDVELGIYPLIRQSCLICGAVGTSAVRALWIPEPDPGGSHPGREAARGDSSERAEPDGGEEWVSVFMTKHG